MDIIRTVTLWRHIDFSKWRHTVGNVLPGCLPNFDEIFQSTTEMKITSGFGKPTAAILEFYFRFRFWRMYGVMSFTSACWLRSNRTIDDGVMTSYGFFKMATMESGMYFWVQVCDGICLRKWKSICLPNFDEISQSTAEINLLLVSERTATILEFYFRFRFWRMYNHRHVILHLSAKLRSNQTIVGGVMTSYPFFPRWPPAAMLDLI